MAYILDGILILILVIAVAAGYHRGFIRSIVQLVGLVAALVVAFSLSASLSAWIFDSFASEPLQEAIVTTLEEDVSSTAAEQLDKIVDALPDFIANAVNADSAAQQALDGLTAQVNASAPALAQSVVTDVVRPLAVALLRFVLFILLFVILMVVVKLLTKVIKPLTKLPVIRQADGALGAVVGAVKGIIFVIIAATVMQLLATYGTLITTQQLEDTYVAGWVVENNPVAAGLNLD